MAITATLVEGTTWRVIETETRFVEGDPFEVEVGNTLVLLDLVPADPSNTEAAAIDSYTAGFIDPTATQNSAAEELAEWRLIAEVSTRWLKLALTLMEWQPQNYDNAWRALRFAAEVESANNGDERLLFLLQNQPRTMRSGADKTLIQNATGFTEDFLDRAFRAAIIYENGGTQAEAQAAADGP